ncbi:hypothetical protein BDZ45DRAFT_749106 [Acephala macrosclerotiorum]|nr:hypothetical protein BDZ45DRAFT_749106 [Acephala macrosclerotiorum]
MNVRVEEEFEEALAIKEEKGHFHKYLCGISRVTAFDTIQVSRKAGKHREELLIGASGESGRHMQSCLSPASVIRRSSSFEEEDQSLGNCPHLFMVGVVAFLRLSSTRAYSGLQISEANVNSHCEASNGFAASYTTPVLSPTDKSDGGRADLSQIYWIAKATEGFHGRLSKLFEKSEAANLVSPDGKILQIMRRRTCSYWSVSLLNPIAEVDCESTAACNYGRSASMVLDFVVQIRRGSMVLISLLDDFRRNRDSVLLPASKDAGYLHTHGTYPKAKKDLKIAIQLYISDRLPLALPRK